MLEKIRKPDKNQKLKCKIINSLLIAILGIALGVLSKWLDSLSIDDSITWMHIIGMLDLNNLFSDIIPWIVIATIISIYSKTPLRAALNVFLFFIFMCISYHYYTIHFLHFNPKSYMKIWYTISFISPILGYICWYIIGNHIISKIMRIFLIICVIIFFLYTPPLISHSHTRYIIEGIMCLILLVLIYMKGKKDETKVTIGSNN